ncbi:hypothetical protein FRB90_007349 [Tulasnella sp. 427]|nr:hypothetical protein FRB90_007349 [Tulasnella sp. 427]
MSTTSTLHTVHSYLGLTSSARQQSPGPKRTSTPQTRRQHGRVLLNMRNALLLICPLLPTKRPTHALSIPEEVWRQILEVVLGDIQLLKQSLAGTEASLFVAGADLLSVCKAFKAALGPILYANPTISSQTSLLALRDTLVKADMHWDAIRRIPYSTPGRWITSLDVSSLSPSVLKSRVATDTALTQLFHLTPLLTHLKLHPKLVLSRRALKSLQESCGARLRSIKSLGVPDAESFKAAAATAFVMADPVTELLTWTPELQALEVVGGGIGDFEDDEAAEEEHDDEADDASEPRQLLSLPKLQRLSLIAIPRSPVFLALLKASLPSLVDLTLTSYRAEEVDEQVLAAQALGLPVDGQGGPGWVGGFPGPQLLPIPISSSASTSLFLQNHGEGLTKLTLLRAPDWPPIPFAPPRELLTTSPNLKFLHFINEKHSGNLESPSIRLDPPLKPHPLTDLTLSRPNDDLLPSLEAILRKSSSNSNQNQSTPVSGSPPRITFSRSPIANTRETSLLPHLATVHFTSVRWLKLASRGAQNTGTNAGMKQWKAALRRYGVKVVDMDGNDA